MKNLFIGLLATGFMTLSSFTTINEVKSVKDIKSEKQKKVKVNFVGTCTASAGGESVTYTNSKLTNNQCCKKAKELLALTHL
jgi:hypothetical protein